MNITKYQSAELRAMAKEMKRGIICAEACEGIKDPVAAIKAAKEALKWLSECGLDDFNCASLEVANKRIQNIARPALALLEGK